MKSYTLYNKKLDRKLSHPKIGLWFTPDINEAKDMLKACQEYLQSINLNLHEDQFVIIDVETGEEV